MSTKFLYEYLIVIILGVVIFLLDYYEFSENILNEVILLSLNIVKSVYFIYLVFKRIKQSVLNEFYFDEFISFVGFSVLLVIFSFGIDYYCLYNINPGTFTGIKTSSYWIMDWVTFFYFSISAFTTAGFGDIIPGTTTARVFVSMELVVAFFFTIMIITNVLELRDSFTRKKSKEV